MAEGRVHRRPGPRTEESALDHHLAANLLQARESDEDRSWALGIVGHQVKNLSRLIEDLLDVTRILQEKIHLRKEVMGLAAVIARAVEITITAAFERGVFIVRVGDFRRDDAWLARDVHPGRIVHAPSPRWFLHRPVAREKTLDEMHGRSVQRAIDGDGLESEFSVRLAAFVQWVQRFLFASLPTVPGIRLRAVFGSNRCRTLIPPASPALPAVATGENATKSPLSL